MKLSNFWTQFGVILEWSSVNDEAFNVNLLDALTVNPALTGEQSFNDLLQLVLNKFTNDENFRSLFTGYTKEELITISSALKKLYVGNNDDYKMLKASLYSQLTITQYGGKPWGTIGFVADADSHVTNNDFTNRTFISGEIVRLKDEWKDDKSVDLEYVIVEDRGERVLVKPNWDTGMSIIPTESWFKKYIRTVSQPVDDIVQQIIDGTYKQDVNEYAEAVQQLTNHFGEPIFGSNADWSGSRFWPIASTDNLSGYFILDNADDNNFEIVQRDWNDENEEYDMIENTPYAYEDVQTLIEVVNNFILDTNDSDYDAGFNNVEINIQWSNTGKIGDKLVFAAIEDADELEISFKDGYWKCHINDILLPNNFNSSMDAMKFFETFDISNFVASNEREITSDSFGKLLTDKHDVLIDQVQTEIIKSGNDKSFVINLDWLFNCMVGLEALDANEILDVDYFEDRLRTNLEAQDILDYNMESSSQDLSEINLNFVVDIEASKKKADGDIIINSTLPEGKILTFYVNDEIQYIEEDGKDACDKYRGVFDDQVMDFYNTLDPEEILYVDESKIYSKNELLLVKLIDDYREQNEGEAPTIAELMELSNLERNPLRDTLDKLWQRDIIVSESHDYTELENVIDFDFESGKYLEALDDVPEETVIGEIDDKLLVAETKPVVVEEVDDRETLTFLTVKQKRSIASNIAEWVKDSGSHVADNLKLVSTWYNQITGRNLTNGRSIGAYPQTLVISALYDDHMIYIDSNKIKAFGEIVETKQEFLEALDAYYKLMRQDGTPVVIKKSNAKPNGYNEQFKSDTDFLLAMDEKKASEEVVYDFSNVVLTDMNKWSKSAIYNYGFIGEVINQIFGYDDTDTEKAKELTKLLQEGLDLSKYPGLDQYGRSNSEYKIIPTALLRQIYNIAKFYDPKLEWVQKFEAAVVNTKNVVPKLKIKYVAVDKQTYDTDKSGLQFTVEINGMKATGFWKPKSGGYNPEGMDIDELRISEFGRISIFNGGGIHRSYEMAATPVLKEKQPANLRFTGKYYDTLPMGKTFIDKIHSALDGTNKVPLSDEFLKYFKISK